MGAGGGPPPATLLCRRFQLAGVVVDAVGDALGQGVAVCALTQALGFGGVGAISHLDQHAGHGRTYKHMEGRALGAAAFGGLAALFAVCVL